MYRWCKNTFQIKCHMRMHIYKSIQLWFPNVPKVYFLWVENEVQVRPFPYLRVSVFLKSQVNLFLLLCNQNFHHKCAVLSVFICPNPSVCMWRYQYKGKHGWKGVGSYSVVMLKDRSRQKCVEGHDLKVMGVQGHGTCRPNTKMVLGKMTQKGYLKEVIYL